MRVKLGGQVGLLNFVLAGLFQFGGQVGLVKFVLVGLIRFGGQVGLVRDEVGLSLGKISVGWFDLARIHRVALSTPVYLASLTFV